MTDPEISLAAGETGWAVLSARGEFGHSQWLPFLLIHLAERQAFVESGSATRLASGGWEAQFRVDASRTTTPVASMDLLALTRTRPPRSAMSPAVESWTLRRRPDDRLELDVEAHDQEGFLGRLLGRIAVLTLVPCELEISTRGGRVHDRIVLERVDGGASAAELQAELDLMLGRFQRVHAHSR